MLPRLRDPLMSLLIVLALICLPIAEAFHFHLADNSKRCFIEDVPSHMDVSIKFAVEKGYGQFVDLFLSDSKGRTVWKLHGESTGKFQSFITEGGTYRLCLFTRSAPGVKSARNKMSSISLSFMIGNEMVDYKGLAEKEKMKPMELQLRVLEDTVRNINSQYVYHKEREKDMRDANELSVDLMNWVALITIGVLMLFSTLQVRYLKSYFRKKRMID